jgi:hypothetical protein
MIAAVPDSCIIFHRKPVPLADDCWLAGWGLFFNQCARVALACIRIHGTVRSLRCAGVPDHHISGPEGWFGPIYGTAWEELHGTLFLDLVLTCVTAVCGTIYGIISGT